MRTAIPPMTDHPDDLKHRLQREHDGHKKPWLQMLYLLASGQAYTRQDVTQLLRVHRNTIGRWLATYIPAGDQKNQCEPSVAAVSLHSRTSPTQVGIGSVGGDSR